MLYYQLLLERFQMKIFQIVFLLVITSFFNIYSQNFWERTNGLDSTNIYSLAINSSGDIFAGTKSRGLFRSTDNGNSWTNLGFPNAWIHGNGIAISPSDEILLAIDNEMPPVVYFDPQIMETTGIL